MNDTKKAPRAYVRAPLSDAQREKNWQVIRAELPAPRGQARRWPMLAAAAGFAVVGAIALSFVWRPRSGAIEGAVLETRAGEQETISLPDGSQVVLDESTRVRLSSVSTRNVRLELDHGSLEAEVTHVDGRPFVVAVGAVEVIDVGTKFEVQSDGQGADRVVRVAVSHGRVKLARVGDKSPPTFLSAGESWSMRVAPPAPSPVASIAVASQPPDAGAPSVFAPPKFRLSRKFHSLYRDGHYVEAYAELDDDDMRRALKQGTAQDLFEIAQAARWSGHLNEAASAYDALRTTHPDDGRAGVAALELGRLRLNELNDPAAAVTAFDDAIRLSPNGPFREDAAARRVQALEQSGDLASCATARESYLREYPDGVHSMTVARRCPSP